MEENRNVENNGKKKRTVKIILIVVAALIVAGAGAYAVGAISYNKGLQEATIKNNVASGVSDYNQHVDGEEAQTDGSAAESTAAADIGIEKAKAIALEQVSGAADSDIIKSKREYEHGRLEYDVDIKYDGYEYEFTIDGESGQIIGSEVERADWF